MSLKIFIVLVLTLFLSSTIESKETSICPEKCLKVSRREKFRCRRLFRSCKPAPCTVTNQNGSTELGFMCTQKESSIIDANPREAPSPSPFIPKVTPIPDEAATGESFLLPEPSEMPKIEYSSTVLEESMEPMSSLESEGYETDIPFPDSSFYPPAEETNESESFVIDNLQRLSDPFQNFERKQRSDPSVKQADILDKLTMRTVLDNILRRKKQEPFYDEDKVDKGKYDSESNDVLSDYHEEKSKKTTIHAYPKIIRVGEPSVVKMSLRIQEEDQIDGLECFRAHHLDSTTQNRTGLYVELADDGTAIYSDDTQQDGVFAGILAITSEALNERIGFEVVPVIDGIENKSHPLSFKAEHLISSYGTRNPNADAIGGGLLKSPRISIVENLRGLQLKVHFIQFGDAVLMSSARFLHDVVGADCDEMGNSNELMEFKDEETVQTVVVDLDRAAEKGLLQDSSSIQLRAAYKEIGNKTPILIMSVLENKATKTELIHTRLSVPVNVGVENECPEAVVGTISVFVGEKTAIVLKGDSMQKLVSAE